MHPIGKVIGLGGRPRQKIIHVICGPGCESNANSSVGGDVDRSNERVHNLAIHHHELEASKAGRVDGSRHHHRSNGVTRNAASRINKKKRERLHLEASIENSRTARWDPSRVGAVYAAV